MTEPEKNEGLIQEENDDKLIEAEDIVTQVALFPKTQKPYLTLNGIFAISNKLGFKITKYTNMSTDSSYIYEFEVENNRGCYQDRRMRGKEGRSIRIRKSNLQSTTERLQSINLRVRRGRTGI